MLYQFDYAVFGRDGGLRRDGAFLVTFDSHARAMRIAERMAVHFNYGADGGWCSTVRVRYYSRENQSMFTVCEATADVRKG